LRANPLFECGIHPNFLPGSTQGDDPEQILDHCLALVPEAVSMRTHSLFQSTRLLDLVIATGRIRVDATMFLPGVDDLKAFAYDRPHGRLIRVPFWWEDDIEIELGRFSWSWRDLDLSGPGLRVFNFHPLHVYLNSRDFGAYRRVFAEQPADLEPYRRTGAGPQPCFLDLLAQARGGKWVRELAGI